MLKPLYERAMSKQTPNPTDLVKLIDSHRLGAEPGASPKWDFDPEICRDFGFRIGRDGTWYYRDSPIGRIALCKLFSSVLRHDGNGNFFLVTPVEQGRIDVDDAPFTAVEVIISGAGRSQTIVFRTNLDHMVTVGPENPIRVSQDPETGEPSPYVLVRDNLEALILRPQFYELVDIAEERKTNDGTEFGVWSAGVFFPLGTADLDGQP